MEQCPDTGVLPRVFMDCPILLEYGHNKWDCVAADNIGADYIACQMVVGGRLLLNQSDGKGDNAGKK